MFCMCARVHVCVMCIVLAVTTISKNATTTLTTIAQALPFANADVVVPVPPHTFRSTFQLFLRACVCVHVCVFVCVCAFVILCMCFFFILYVHNNTAASAATSCFISYIKH